MQLVGDGNLKLWFFDGGGCFPGGEKTGSLVDRLALLHN